MIFPYNWQFPEPLYAYLIWNSDNWIIATKWLLKQRAEKKELEVLNKWKTKSFTTNSFSFPVVYCIIFHCQEVFGMLIKSNPTHQKQKKKIFIYLLNKYFRFIFKLKKNSDLLLSSVNFLFHLFYIQSVLIVSSEVNEGYKVYLWFKKSYLKHYLKYFQWIIKWCKIKVGQFNSIWFDLKIKTIIYSL